MTIKNLIEKYEKSIEGLEEGMSLFDDEGGAVYASFAREIEIYETVIADLQEFERPQYEWKPKPVTFGTCFLQGFECECGRIVMQKENFCPDCGAQMVGGEP